MKAINYVYRSSKRIIIAFLLCALFLSLTCGTGHAAAMVRFHPDPLSGTEALNRISSAELMNTTETLSTRLGAVQIASLVPQDIAELDEFGWSVALSGNTAVVGSRNEDPDLGGGPISNGGAAYIFVKSGKTWIQEAKLVPSDIQAGDTFGVSVAIDGNTVVIGATGVDVGKKSNAGAAYIFTRSGINWKQRAKLLAPEPHTDDGFGCSVAIDNITVAIGADSEDQPPLIDVGAAYIFLMRGNSWDFKSKLLPSKPNLGTFFGTSVSIYGDRLVVGASEANPYGISGVGSAYVFIRQGNQWKQEAALSPPLGRSGDFFGHSTAIYGQTIVIGAILSDPDWGNGRITNAGSAYVYKLINNKWEAQAQLIAEDALPFDNFGQSVTVFNDVVAVGANRKSFAGYDQVGAVYLYERKGNEWQQQSKVLAEYVYEGDEFGASVSLYNNDLLVGATGRDPAGFAQAGESIIFQVVPMQLPETGFAPSRNTLLAPQPNTKLYSTYGDLVLKIPSLLIEAKIVGVPEGGSGWDTSWLWDQVGYLEGTAFPTWAGNSALAGHVNLPNGKPGPFEKLANLKYGQQILIEGWHQRYIYEVREVTQVNPSDLTVLRHEEYPWLTLIACRDFDPESENYLNRTIVRAILIRIQDE
jgi:LPXTG-site transpeptidase (sortase) family protein